MSPFKVRLHRKSCSIKPFCCAFAPISLSPQRTQLTRRGHLKLRKHQHHQHQYCHQHYGNEVPRYLSRILGVIPCGALAAMTVMILPRCGSLLVDCPAALIDQ